MVYIGLLMVIGIFQLFQRIIGFSDNINETQCKHPLGDLYSSVMWRAQQKIAFGKWALKRQTVYWKMLQFHAPVKCSLVLFVIIALGKLFPPFNLYPTASYQILGIEGQRWRQLGNCKLTNISDHWSWTCKLCVTAMQLYIFYMCVRV